jgi:hypothetical protein
LSIANPCVKRIRSDLIWQQFGNNIGHVRPTYCGRHAEWPLDAKPDRTSALLAIGCETVHDDALQLQSEARECCRFEERLAYVLARPSPKSNMPGARSEDIFTVRPEFQQPIPGLAEQNIVGNPQVARGSVTTSNSIPMNRADGTHRLNRSGRLHCGWHQNCTYFWRART